MSRPGEGGNFDDPLGFNEDERRILDSTPDWYMEKLAKWSQSLPATAYEVSELLELQKANPSSFKEKREALEGLMVIAGNLEDFRQSLKKKFLDERYNEQRSQEIADEYIRKIKSEGEREPDEHDEQINQETREREIDEDIQGST